MSQFYDINICQAMISRPYNVYSMHEMAKIGIQTREKSQSLSAGMVLIAQNPILEMFEQHKGSADH